MLLLVSYAEPRPDGRATLQSAPGHDETDGKDVAVRPPWSAPLSRVVHFDELDDPGLAEVVIWEGLGLTDLVIAAPSV
jgi:hypothetical protein